MKHSEAVLLLTALNRAGVLHVVEGAVAVWADALQDIRYEDATQAVRDIIANRTHQERWTVPGDVIAGVRTIRNARLRTMLGGTEPMPPEELADDVTAYNNWRRGFNKALGDGHNIHQAETAAAAAAGIPPIHRPAINYRLGHHPRQLTA